MKSAEVTDVYSGVMAKSAMRVGIVGAGIGGLSLALALRERGRPACSSDCA
jgi:cation diffusion facilitator CzcD-associated flavoprotein CzcO